MQILFINYEYPPIGGGAGRANEYIARELAALGNEVAVITSSYDRLPSREKRNGYTIYRIPALRRRQEGSNVFEMATFMVSACIYALRWAKKYRPDVVFAFFTIPSGPAAYLIRRILNIPYIVVLCGGDVPGQGAIVPGPMGKRLRFYHAMTRGIISYIWQCSSKVVALSEGMKQLAQSSTTRPHFTIIPNGVDSSFFNINKQPHSTKLPFTVLTISRLCPQKGIDYLIRGFKRSQELSEQDMQLWIVGEGPHRPVLEKIAYEECKLSSKVVFFGWQEAESIRRLHERADLFVIASFGEGLSLAVLEAMAAGLPILGTAVSGVRELVSPGVNGLLVPPGNDEAIATSLVAMMHDTEKLFSMGKASYNMAQSYNWRRIAEAYLSLARQAI